MISCNKTVLDGRYEIRRLLDRTEKESFFEGWHCKIEKKILIQKLEMKGSDVLSRARELGDFSDLPGIFHVCDQFETDGSAYIVFDYPTGINMEKYLLTSGRIAEKDLIKMFRTLLVSLQKMQEAGLQNLSVNMKNLYLQENGECMLFPEITVYMPGYLDYSYQISERMYQCLSGKKPPDKQIRLLFDEMEPLDKADPTGDREIHQIVEKGLHTDPECMCSLDEMRKKLDNWMEIHTEKKHGKSYFWTGGILLFFLVCGILSGVYYKFEEKIRFLGIKTETILLVPSEEMTHKDYQRALKVLEKRMQQIAGGQKYLVKDNDEKIKIVMPLELYQNAFDEEIWKLYLSTPMKLSLVISDQFEGYGVMQPTSYMTFEKSDIIKIEEESTEKKESASLKEEPAKKMKLMLSSNGAEKIKKVLQERKRDSSFAYVCMNVGSLDYGSELEFATIEENYQEIEFLENSHFEAVHTWWEEDSFDSDFTMEAEIPAEWAERTTSAFTYWVKSDEIKEPAVTMEYQRPYFEGEKSDKGDFFHNINGLADRLEILKIPYSIGTVYGDYDRLVVKTKQSDMSEFLGKIMLMDSYDLSVRDYYGNEIYNNDIIIEPEKTEDGTVRWKVRISCYEDKMQEFMQNVLEGDGSVYLVGPGQYLIGRTKLKEEPEKIQYDSVTGEEEYEIIFDETYLGETGKFTKDMDAVAEFINKMSERYGLSTDFVLKTFQFSENKEVAASRKQIHKNWEISSSKELKKIKKAAASEDAYVEFIETNSESWVGKKDLNIILHMDVSQEYADTAVERIQKLWKICDLEHSSYNTIGYYIGEYMEYPRMILHKLSWNFSGERTIPEWEITAIQYLDEYGLNFENAVNKKIMEDNKI